MAINFNAHEATRIITELESAKVILENLRNSLIQLDTNGINERQYLRDRVTDIQSQILICQEFVQRKF